MYTGIGTTNCPVDCGSSLVQAEGIDRVAGAGPEVNHAIGDGRRSTSHIVRKRIAPQRGSGTSIQRKLSTRSDGLTRNINNVVGEGGRRTNIAAGGEIFPDQSASASFQRVNITIIGPDIDSAVRKCRRRRNLPSGCIAPLLRAGGGIQGVELAIVRANVDDAA